MMPYVGHLRPNEQEVVKVMKSKFNTLSKVVDAAEKAELPRGTKMVIGPNSTEVKAKNEVLFKFEGTPAQLAKHMLGNVVKSKLKVELVDTTGASTEAGNTTGK